MLESQPPVKIFSMEQVNQQTENLNIQEPSKSSIKKQQALDEKAKRKAEVQARLAEEEAQRDAEDFASANYGLLKMNQSSEKTARVWTPIGTLSPENIDQKVLIRARVHNVRGSGKNSFIVLRDRYITIQAIASVNETTVSKKMLKFISACSKESIVDITGKVVKPAVEVEACSHKNIEILVESFFIVSEAIPRLPISVDDASRAENDSEDVQLATVNLETRLNHRVIDLRTVANQAIFTIQSGIVQLFKSFLLKQGFIEIHTPKIISAASEGGANVFKISYFKGEAYLAQSPQLYKQMAICADFGKVFEIAPVFRAENSFTHRHMTEFMGLDLEMSFNEHYHEVLNLLGQLFIHIFKGLETEYSRELEAVKKQYPYEPFLCPETPVIITFAEGVKLLREAGETMDDHEDLTTAKERVLGAIIRKKYNTDFYILDKFPTAVRPFYTMPSAADPNYANAYDFFMRGEEIMSGAQRVHDYDFLLKRAIEHKVDLKTVEAYLDSFKYGASPHAGGGIGLERVVMLYLNLGNIRKSSMFPRDPKRITP